MRPVIDINFVAKRAYHDLADYWNEIGQTPLQRWEATHPIMREMSVSSIQRHMAYRGGLTPEISHALWFTEAYTRGWRYGRTFSIEPIDGHPRNPRMVQWNEMNPYMQRVSTIVCNTFQLYLPDLESIYNPNNGTGGMNFGGGRINNMTVFNQ